MATSGYMLHVIYIIDSWTICGALATEETEIPYVKRIHMNNTVILGITTYILYWKIITVFWLL